MPHKEHYRHTLPHFQQPRQAYFITWCLKDAVSSHAIKRYSQQFRILKSQLAAAGAADSDPLLISCRSESATPNKPTSLKNNDLQDADWNPHHPKLKQKLQQEYYALRKKYLKAYNELLDAALTPKINLSKPEYTKIIIDSLNFWERKKLINQAFCIMPNHVHWVVQLLEKDHENHLVYLEDILYSIKRFTATQINKEENRSGTLWQKESFETTIRDDKHLLNAIEYTLNNPVNAGFVKDWKNWQGSSRFQSAD
jgi:REP element-mobilizing transposase RayT